MGIDTKEELNYRLIKVYMLVVLDENVWWKTIYIYTYISWQYCGNL